MPVSLKINFWMFSQLKRPTEEPELPPTSKQTQAHTVPMDFITNPECQIYIPTFSYFCRVSGMFDSYTRIWESLQTCQPEWLLPDPSHRDAKIGQISENVPLSNYHVESS